MIFAQLLLRALPALLVLALSAGCASVSVKDSIRIGTHFPDRRPAKILIRPFTFNDRDLRVDRSGDRLAMFQYDLREKMTRHLARRLKRLIAPTQAIASTAPLPVGNYWLITGNFDRVHQGSRLLRSTVGLGFGRTRLDTTIVVRDLSTRKARPFLVIRTTGGSNISPGIGGVATVVISGPSAWMNLANTLDGLLSGLTFDTVRTSREINAALSEFLFQEGIITADQAVMPKRLGEIPHRLRPFSPSPLQGSLRVVGETPLVP